MIPSVSKYQPGDWLELFNLGPHLCPASVGLKECDIYTSNMCVYVCVCIHTYRERCVCVCVCVCVCDGILLGHKK